MGWLNAAAPSNMYAMFVTRPVFQALMPSAPPLLNAVAPRNMFDMSVTLDTSQVPMSLLKALAKALANMPAMLVTLAVFHLEMSALNCALFLNRSSMSVTRLTSQHGISVAPAPVPATPQSAPAAQQPTPAH